MVRNMIFLLTVFLILSIVIAYYMLAPVKIYNAEPNDVLIKNGDFVYIEKKMEYNKGDLVLILQCENDEKNYCSREQATRVIGGIPFETIKHERKNNTDFFMKNSDSIIVSETIIKNDQYFMLNAKNERVDFKQQVLTKQNIYGIIKSYPSRNWSEKWRFIVQRTINLPNFVKIKISEQN